MQVGYVGLLKAINNYNPEVGDSLSAYAQPCISGEIKRHFRDKRWQIHVRRSAQELLLELRKASEELTQQLGRPPAEAELAERLGVSAGAMQEAARRTSCSAPTRSTLRCPTGTIPPCSRTCSATTIPPWPTPSDMEAVNAHWRSCPSASSASWSCASTANLHPDEIGDRLGISQMHVSRLLTRALAT